MATASTTAQDTYERLCDHAREVALLTSVRGLLEWDERTQLPPAGAEYRAEQVRYLAGMVHQRQTSPQVGEWLAELSDSPLAADPHGDTGAVIVGLQYDYDKLTKMPRALVEELAGMGVVGQQSWGEARKADDFARFRPVLEKIIELKRQEAEALGYDDVPYDALLDEFEPGEKTADVARVFAALRDELVPLVQELVDSGRKPQREVIERPFAIDTQEEFGRSAATAIGFDFDAGRLDVSQHPFCAEIGPLDTRLTTRYNERCFVTGLFSILHEAGHGIYEQGLPNEDFGLPTGQATSLGMHESQSRMWENHVGRSRAFWEYFYPQAQSAFADALADVPLDVFHFAINEVRPSLIRTEADEVTYDLHIFVRFELEQALLEGDLAVADLPGAWNGQYRKYLGIEPTSDAGGVLQDVHWGACLLGYFPTYTLGNLYASQLFVQAREELGDLDAMFARGQFEPLREWLRTNVHRQGRRFRASDLVERVTGRSVSHDALVDRYRRKFGALYGL